MALMDDFVKKTEEGLRALKETAEGIALTVEKQAKIAGKKMEIMRIQRNIQKAYAEVGEQVHREYNEGGPLVVESPFLQERLTAVSQMKAEIKGIEEEIEAIRGPQSAVREEPPEDEERKV